MCVGGGENVEFVETKRKMSSDEMDDTSVRISKRCARTCVVVIARI